MKKLVSLTMLIIGITAVASAQVAPVPEIDGASTAQALALLGGALMVLRSRKR